MGEAPCAADEAAFAAGCCDREIVQRDQHRHRFSAGVAGAVDFDPPRAAVGFDAMAAQFAADLDQRVMDAVFAERLRHQIDCEPFGDAAEVDRPGIVPAQTVRDGVAFELLPAAGAMISGNVIRFRRGVPRAAWSKAPEVDQRAHGRVVGAIGFPRDADGMVHHAVEFGRQCLPFV